MKLPRREPLASQVADTIRQEIAAGGLKERLPASRELSTQLKVSRETIQQAIRILSEEGMLEPTARMGVRILTKPRRTRRAPGRQFGLLMAQHAAPQSFQYDAIFHELESNCFRSGIPLSLHRGERYFRPHSTRALEELVRLHPGHCWILRTSNATVQEWFSQRKIPCVIWGLSRQNANLPSVSVDISAGTRHAAGTMLGLGHRRLALFSEQSANTHLTRDVFNQSIKRSNHSQASARICEHESNLESIERHLNRCLEGPSPVTGIFVTRAYAYVALVGILNRRGLRVPDDLSLISRDNDPLFDFMSPRPSSFTFSTSQFAKELFSLARHVSSGELPSSRHRVILPEFTQGESVRSLAD